MGRQAIGWLLLATLVPASMAAAEGPPEMDSRIAGVEPVERETLRYRWQLGGFLGVVAGLFIPGRGDATLITLTDATGNLHSEVQVTSELSREGEYWLYGSEIDPQSLHAVRIWNAYRQRGKETSKETAIEEEVIGIVSGIQMLRHDPPATERRSRIWSKGLVFPVEIRRGEQETRILDGKPVAGTRFTIRGVKVAGERHWRGRLEMLLADDPWSTPLEIALRQAWARVRLELVAVERGGARPERGSGRPPAGSGAMAPRRDGTGQGRIGLRTGSGDCRPESDRCSGSI